MLARLRLAAALHLFSWLVGHPLVAEPLGPRMYHDALGELAVVARLPALRKEARVQRVGDKGRVVRRHLLEKLDARRQVRRVLGGKAREEDDRRLLLRPRLAGDAQADGAVGGAAVGDGSGGTDGAAGGVD